MNTGPRLFQPRDTLLFEGDSLTSGLGNNCGRLLGWDKTWAHLLDEWLFAHRADWQLECKNLAVGGSTAQTMLQRVGPAVAVKPQVALFTVGTNDGILGVPVGTFASQLDQWCGQLRAAGCRDLVHVAGFPVCPNADDDTARVLVACEPYWQAARRVLENHGGRQTDVGPYLLSRSRALDARWHPHTVYSHGVHYNAIGNELILGAVLSSFKESYHEA